MFQSRDEIRQVYLTVWQKMCSQAVLEPMEAIIADVIQIHPEYQQLLDRNREPGDLEFTPEAGQTNPFLHMGMHIALREQAQTNLPRGISTIYQRLVKRRGIHEAEHAMMDCLGEMLWKSQRYNIAPDEAAYVDNLRKL